MEKILGEEMSSGNLGMEGGYRRASLAVNRIKYDASWGSEIPIIFVYACRGFT
jgi:hypothetical protein